MRALALTLTLSRCELSALVLLSAWPMYEMFKG